MGAQAITIMNQSKTNPFFDFLPAAAEEVSLSSSPVQINFTEPFNEKVARKVILAIGNLCDFILKNANTAREFKNETALSVANQIVEDEAVKRIRTHSKVYPIRGDYTEILKKMSSIAKLKIHAKGIEELPESIEYLSGLQELSLVGNNLTTLPKTLKKCTHIKIINLNGNGNLSEIPLVLSEMTWIQKIKVGNTLITTAPVIFKEKAEGNISKWT